MKWFEIEEKIRRYQIGITIVICILMYLIGVVTGTEISNLKKPIQQIDKNTNSKRIIIIPYPNENERFTFTFTSFDNSLDASATVNRDELKSIRDDIIKIIPVEVEVKK